MNDMRRALGESDAITYVQNNAHFCGTKYGVRHPQLYSGGRALIGDDPSDLVVRLCKIYGIDRRYKSPKSLIEGK